MCFDSLVFSDFDACDSESDSESISSAESAICASSAVVMESVADGTCASDASSSVVALTNLVPLTECEGGSRRWFDLFDANDPRLRDAHAFCTPLMCSVWTKLPTNGLGYQYPSLCLDCHVDVWSSTPIALRHTFARGHLSLIYNFQRRSPSLRSMSGKVSRIESGSVWTEMHMA